MPASEGPFSIIDLYLEAAQTGLIFGYDHSTDDWLDVGKPEALEAAADFLKKKPQFRLSYGNDLINKTNCQHVIFQCKISRQPLFRVAPGAYHRHAGEASEAHRRAVSRLRPWQGGQRDERGGPCHSCSWWGQLSQPLWPIRIVTFLTIGLLVGLSGWLCVLTARYIPAGETGDGKSCRGPRAPSTNWFF